MEARDFEKDASRYHDNSCVRRAHVLRVRHSVSPVIPVSEKVPKLAATSGDTFQL